LSVITQTQPDELGDRRGLTVSSRTVDNHVSAIFRKLRVKTRDQARAQAARLGVSLPEPDTGPYS
jgi:ATP/maltotriose-dependent transcriptional regulator MalT